MSSMYLAADNSSIIDTHEFWDAVALMDAERLSLEEIEPGSVAEMVAHALTEAANTSFHSEFIVPASAARSVVAASKAVERINEDDEDDGESGPFLSEVLLDISYLRAGIDLKVVARNPLWTGRGREKPYWSSLGARDIARSSTSKFDHWTVWADWYADVLAGRQRGEAWDACFVDLDPDDPLPWDDGPKAVNDRIAARLKKLKELEGEVPAEPAGVERPAQPLPPPTAATSFRVVDGLVDLVVSDAWASRESSAAAYHQRAVSIAQDLLGKIENVEPALGATIVALIDVLGTRVADVQPDNLRMAWRSIESRARAYGHPNAAGEISVTSVSLLFELSGVLTDLQAIAAPALQAHEEAIRQLALTSAGAAEVKPVLDLVSERLADSPAVTEQVAAVLTAAREVSDAAVDPDVQVQVESSRILQTENLALAIAHELASPQANVSSVTYDSKSENAADKPGSTRKRSSSGRRSARRSNGDIDLDDWVKRFRGRLDAKLPEAVADGLIKLASSPRLSIAGLGAFLVAITNASPALGGGLVLISAWIVFQLFQKRSPGPPAP